MVETLGCRGYGVQFSHCLSRAIVEKATFSGTGLSLCCLRSDGSVLKKWFGAQVFGSVVAVWSLLIGCCCVVRFLTQKQPIQISNLGII